MPQVKKEHYFQKRYDDLERFISYFYQIDLAREDKPETILEIGKGNGTVSDYLKKLDYKVTTCDFDENLKPDYVVDVRKLPFPDNSFDAILAYEVLEHLPFEDFEKALGELGRVSKKIVLISLPYRSTGFEWIFKFPLIKTLFKKDFFDLFLRIPLKFGGIEVSGQHYWEIDGGQYPIRKIRKFLKKNFLILKELRRPLNHYHYFFTLEKKSYENNNFGHS